MPTPLTDDELLDEESLRRLVRFYLAAGVDGLWVLGSGAESQLLGPAVREAVVTVVANEVGSSIPVVAGVGQCGTGETVREIEKVVSLGVAGIHAEEPHCYQLSSEELVEYFLSLADATTVPLVLYLHPERWPAGSLLPSALPVTIGRLAEHPRIIGAKDSIRDFREHQRLLFTLDADDFAVMSGAGRLMLAHLSVGGRGAVHGDAAVAPGAFVELHASFRRRDFTTAASIQRRVAPLGDALGQHAAATHKFALSVLGLCSARMARPLHDLDGGRRDVVLEAMRKAELLPASGSEIAGRFD